MTSFKMCISIIIERSQMRKANFKFKEVRKLKEFLINKENLRDLVLLSTAVDTCLRSCDLRALTVRKITNPRGIIQKYFSITMQKTKLKVHAQLRSDTMLYLKAWIKLTGRSGDDYLFSGKNRLPKIKLSHMRYSRIVKQWALFPGLDEMQYSTHSLKRTRPALIYKESKNLEYCRILLGHSGLGSTSAYLGIDVGQALCYSDGFKF